jgi:serine/threonine-protein kinase RsbW
METLRLPATMESLERFCAFVVQRARQCGIAAERLFRIELVVEELLTNVIHYAYSEEPGDLQIQCFLKNHSRFCLQIQDWGCPFNPLTREDPDLTQSVCERPIGGLGIYLVRVMANELHYQRAEDSNHLTLCFELHPETCGD